MYQNSVCVRGHAKKRLHKAKLKKQYLVSKPYGDYKRYSSWRDYISKCDDDWQDTTYWKRYYCSNARKFAKRATSRRMRSEFRNRIKSADFEELSLPHHADYRKNLDYDWVIW